jgi:hypothetical protein
MIKRVIFYLSSIGRFWQDKTISHTFRWNIAIIIIEVFILVIFFNNFPQEIPLFRSLIWGETQLAPPSFLFIFPIFSLTIVLINGLLAFTFQKNYFLSHLLISVSLIFSLLSLVPIIKIILLFP